MIKSREGYIAIVSALIVMAVLLILATGVALSSFLARGGSSGSYYKEISHSLAESCVYKALLKLAEDPSYSGNESLVVASSSLSVDSCNIISIVPAGADRSISAKGAFQGASTNLRVVVDGDLNILKWEEVPVF